MSQALTIGKKISLALAAVLVMAVVLGSLAVWQLSKIKNTAETLADDYAPEVGLVVDLDANLRRIMYELRGYAFTEEEKFLENARPWQKKLQEGIVATGDLAAKSSVLVKLGPALKIFQEEISLYD